EYLRRVPKVSWTEARMVLLPKAQMTPEEAAECEGEEGEVERKVALPVTDYYRLAVRRGAHPADERSVRPIVLLKGQGHIDRVFSVTFRSERDAVVNAGYWSSLPLDFYHRTTGKKDFRGDIGDKFPIAVGDSPAVMTRALALIGLTTHYADLWEQ